MRTELDRIEPATRTFQAIRQMPLSVSIKSAKYFIDSAFRDKVVPVPGSVVFCDLKLGAEHSGIHVVDGMMSNIEVTGKAECEVTTCNAWEFTSKSTLGRQIYVSCNRHGAVGSVEVARGAAGHVGERGFYGLVFKNCHQFSTRCLNYAPGGEAPAWSDALLKNADLSTWEATIKDLKIAARRKLGATKWRLWDWQRDEKDAPPPEPDWNALARHFENMPLDADGIRQIREELAEARAYEEEIADENIPDPVRSRLGALDRTLSDISDTYDEVKELLVACPDTRFSYAGLKACGGDFAALASTLQDNPRIRELCRKLGRDFISEDKKKRGRVPEASRSEVHGTHRSDDLMRLLPSELVNLEDEALEMLFYARLLEHNLLSYELQGITHGDGDTTEKQRKQSGPVVACLDTSGSMAGAPLLKAKALLLAIANLLKKEGRSLHVLLFGAAGELREFSMAGAEDSQALLQFLNQGFAGGTDFETPLRRAFDIIGTQGDYKKADVLMISDGDCVLSSSFLEEVKASKTRLDCTVYSVLCAGARVEDAFSDEVVVL